MTNHSNPPVVVNKYKSDFDIYIGRGSKWGNPFPMDRKNTRKQVIAQHRVHLYNQIKSGVITRADFEELSGKRLGCFCKPLACHGDTLVRAWLVLDVLFTKEEE